MRKRLPRKKSLFSKAQAQPADISVKQIILDISGDETTDPATLHDTLSLRDNIHFNDQDYILLQIRLEEYVRSQKNDASVTTDEANACETVGDCVTLVEGKIS